MVWHIHVTDILRNAQIVQNASSLGADLSQGFIIGGHSAGARKSAVLAHELRDDPFFKDTPLTAYDDKHDAFSQFLAATTTGETVTLSLSGTSNADASTAVGVLSLKDIDFSVSTDIGGLQGLNAKPVTVGNLDVKHGYSDYLLITLDGDLYNPR